MQVAVLNLKSSNSISSRLITAHDLWRGKISPRKASLICDPQNLSGVTKNGVKSAEFAPNLGSDKRGKKYNCHQRSFNIKKNYETMVQLTGKKGKKQFLDTTLIMQLTNKKLSVLRASVLMLRCKMLRMALYVVTALPLRLTCEYS